MDEKYSGSENFGPSHYDYNFDFDFVLQFSAFEYFLIGLYLVFVVPFILVSEQISKFLQQHKKREELLEKAIEDSDFAQPEFCVGPCCLWSGVSKE